MSPCNSGFSQYFQEWQSRERTLQEEKSRSLLRPGLRSPRRMFLPHSMGQSSHRGSVGSSAGAAEVCALPPDVESSKHVQTKEGCWGPSQGTATPWHKWGLQACRRQFPGHPCEFPVESGPNSPKSPHFPGDPEILQPQALKRSYGLLSHT